MYAIRSYYVCDAAIARLLCEEGPARIREMDAWGVGWARENGAFKRAFAPGHDRPRCVYVDFRITSYNVCYTKLLRNSQHFLEVMLSALYLARLLRLDPRRTMRVVTAALMHDFHHDGSRNNFV